MCRKFRYSTCGSPLPLCKVRSHTIVSCDGYNLCVSMLFHRSMILAPLALIVLAAAGCSSSHATVAAADESAPPVVAVAKTERRDLSRETVLTAEFRPYQEVDVMAKVSGYIKKINVDVGDRVQQGQLLATLEVPEMKDDLTRADATISRANSEIARAQDDVRRAESAHRIAHLTYERLANVAKNQPGMIAQQELDAAQSKDLEAEAQVAGAKSNLDTATQSLGVSRAEQGKVRTMIDYTRVTAPFAGVVTKRFADTGSMIQAGTASQSQARPVVRVSENSTLRLIVPVPESAVPSIHLGETIEVRVPTLKRSFTGRVARFADRLQAATRTMETEIDVPNHGLMLMPGMYAEVTLVLEKRDGAIAVPITALQREGDTATVLVVTAANRVETRKLETGLETARDVEVKSGLRDGDMVVVGNRAVLKNGEEVKPKITSISDGRNS